MGFGVGVLGIRVGVLFLVEERGLREGFWMCSAAAHLLFINVYY